MSEMQQVVHASEPLKVGGAGVALMDLPEPGQDVRIVPDGTAFSSVSERRG
jgi:hypothetical protein